MKENTLKNTVFSKNVIEFTTVALQYCNFIENFEGEDSDQFIDKMTKILPLLYLKVVLVEETEPVNDEEPETMVTESDYNYVLSKLYHILGKNDTYLEVFLQDMKYSETPIAASVSEDLSDIYQDLKNFITIYERGIIENMNDALFVCIENFKAYWGQKLVNVMRALHILKYAEPDEDSLEEIEDNTDIW